MAMIHMTYSYVHINIGRVKYFSYLIYWKKKKEKKEKQIKIKKLYMRKLCGVVINRRNVKSKNKKEKF